MKAQAPIMVRRGGAGYTTSTATTYGTNHSDYIARYNGGGAWAAVGQVVAVGATGP